MTRTGTNHAHLRRALRREVPSTVGLLADEHDFTAMRQYRTFAFDDHTTYLRQVEALLRTLAGQGGHTTVTLFDPEEYAVYCAETAIDPDHPTSRSRFTAHLAATGARVTYTGQPLSTLLPELVDTAVRHATWEYATTVLATAGDCATCGKEIGEAAFARAARLLARLLDAAGPGTHHLVCSVRAADDQLLAVLHAHGTTRPAAVDDAAAAEFTAVLAAASPSAPPVESSCAPPPRATATDSTAGASPAAPSSRSQRPRSSPPTAPTPPPENPSPRNPASTTARASPRPGPRRRLDHPPLTPDTPKGLPVTQVTESPFVEHGRESPRTAPPGRPRAPRAPCRRHAPRQRPARTAPACTWPASPAHREWTPHPWRGR